MHHARQANRLKHAPNVSNGSSGVAVVGFFIAVEDNIAFFLFQ